jgi:1-acyl-sn-glycerol-3-phosphate acyltransferase
MRTPVLNARPQQARSVPLLRRVVEAALRAYMRAWHDLRVEGREHVPAEGPALVVANHVSILDVLALAAANPYTRATSVVKASAFRVPVVRHILAAWRAIPVERDGRDLAGVRALLRALRGGWVVGIAAEGRRSRDGGLGAINPVLARIAVSSGVPVVPVGIAGSFEALPPGAMLPKRRRIVLRVGPAFRLGSGTSQEEAAHRIRGAIAALLPPT